MSSLMETGMSDEVLLASIQLCELGVNPEALAAVIKNVNSYYDSLN